MDTKPWTMKQEIDRVIETMKTMSPGSKEYKQAAENVRVLIETANMSKISKDALLAAGVNIVGILLVLNFERLGVVTSKAFSMLRKS